MASAMAIRPPVDVPQIKSNWSDKEHLNRFSRCSRILAEYRPLIPPPSMDRILKGFFIYFTGAPFWQPGFFTGIFYLEENSPMYIKTVPVSVCRAASHFKYWEPLLRLFGSGSPKAIWYRYSLRYLSSR